MKFLKTNGLILIHLYKVIIPAKAGVQIVNK
jgi:hypothetical protein